MNAEDFNKIVAARMAWCNKTLCAKGDEYARDGDRLWNFKAAGRKRNQHPAQALAGMEVKHDVSVDDIIDGLARGIVPPKELVAEKIGDSINYLLLLEGRIEEPRGEVPEMNAAFKTPRPEVYGGYVVCSACGLKCSIGSEQEQSVNLTGRCTICRDEKERETYTVPPLQDGDDDPAVHVVPDRTSRSGDVEASVSAKRKYAEPITWQPCPND